MHCSLIEPHLAAYIDGDLDDVTTVSVEEHLKECRSCREMSRDMRLASAVLAQWKPAEAKVSFVETLRRRIEAEAPDRIVLPKREHARVRRLVWAGVRMLTAAATIVVGLGVAYLAWDSLSSPRVRTVAERVASISNAVQRAGNMGDLRGANVVIQGILEDQWASSRPNVEALTQLEVVSTMMTTETQPGRDGDIRRILKMLGRERLALRVRDTGMDFAWAARDCFSSAFEMGGAFAQEPPTDLGTLLDEAMKLEAGGDMDQAIEKYRLAGEDRVLSLRANIMQANLEMKLGHAKEAAELLDKAYKLTKPDTFYRDVVIELRERSARAVDLQRRIDDLKGELLRTEKDFDVLSNIGSLQVKAGNLKGAEETFDQIARGWEGKGDRKEVLRARLLKAWCGREMNPSGPAFDEFSKLIGEARNVSPEVSALAQFERAKTLQLRGRYAQAIDDYRDLSANMPGLSPASIAAIQFQIGYIYLVDLGKKDQAMETFKSLEKGRCANEPFGRLASAVMKDVSIAPER